MARGRALALGCCLLLLLLAGCARWRPEPVALPFPDPPALTWRACGEEVCLSRAEADRLAEWLDAVNAFRHARERLRPPAP